MKYILYARKSSESEDRQALSIDSQISELLKLAEREDRKVDNIFKESMSAKKMGRPIFNEMLEYISKQKDCVILSWKVDRLTRNIFDGAKIIELLENGNIKEIRTIDKVIMDNPTDKFMLSIDFGVGKKYSDDLSVNVKRGNRAKLEKGEWPSLAPFGYLNEKINKTIIPDPERAKFVSRIFQLYVLGTRSLEVIANILYKEGLRTESGGKVGKSTIHRVLVNPFYYGVMLRDGKYYQGKHETIITKQLFDQAQDILLGKNHSKKQKHFFPYRGFMTCASCGCALTADKKKGHTYYYCTNGKGKCEQHKKYLRSEEIDKLIANALGNLKFDSKLIQISYLAAKEKLAMRKDNLEDIIGTIEKQLKTNAERQSKLLDRHLDNLVSEDAYKAKLKELEKDKIDLENELKRIQKSGKGNFTFEPVKSVFLAGNKAKKDFLKAKDDGKRHLLEILFSNLSMESGNLASISFKMPYQLLANAPKNGDFNAMLGR
ncbi:MAG TPA: recombinase family protein [Candidatus Bathyarchaeia archaeon]|nr:recombinase family protein [Candidatus Bathyarchaeia archaeon]